jgi:hypothetical protein
VFEKKKYTPEEIITLLQSNDSGFLHEVIGLRESFGKDMEDVNDFSHKISERIFSMTETGELVFGEGFLSASIQFIDAAIIVFPWFQRYYMGGYQKAYTITLDKQKAKKSEVLAHLMVVLSTQENQ